MTPDGAIALLGFLSLYWTPDDPPEVRAAAADAWIAALREVDDATFIAARDEYLQRPEGRRRPLPFDVLAICGELREREQQRALPPPRIDLARDAEYRRALAQVVAREDRPEIKRLGIADEDVGDYIARRGNRYGLSAAEITAEFWKIENYWRKHYRRQEIPRAAVEPEEAQHLEAAE
jgi:hypothetical protein